VGEIGALGLHPIATGVQRQQNEVVWQRHGGRSVAGGQSYAEPHSGSSNGVRRPGCWTPGGGDAWPRLLAYAATSSRRTNTIAPARNVRYATAVSTGATGPCAARYKGWRGYCTDESATRVTRVTQPDELGVPL
jgi:hypothetical protein